jgi:hypothetical protein
LRQVPRVAVAATETHEWMLIYEQAVSVFVSLSLFTLSVLPGIS